MPTYIPDNKTKRYVIISPVRKNRPNDQAKPQTPQPTIYKCPFCPGNESMTPPEVDRLPKNSTEWAVRVVPNKYPITDIHEVIILSTQHTKDFSLLSLEQAQLVMKMFFQRYVHHSLSGNVIIFGNHGEEAGASLPHPHAQLVVVPRDIPFDAIEIEEPAHILKETADFNVYCPKFSQWPFEVWIAPKAVGSSFADITEEQRNALAFLLQKTLQTLRSATSQPDFAFNRANKVFAYNYYISHTKNFYVRVIPRLIHRAGFELGTGLSVNIVPPEDAAGYLGKLWI